MQQKSKSQPVSFGILSRSLLLYCGGSVSNSKAYLSMSEAHSSLQESRQRTNLNEQELKSIELSRGHCHLTNHVANPLAVARVCVLVFKRLTALFMWSINRVMVVRVEPAFASRYLLSVIRVADMLSPSLYPAIKYATNKLHSNKK